VRILFEIPTPSLCAPAGHTSGVFISTCSSSPRSHQPCAYLAAVVQDKTLVAELYIPRSSTLPDPWAGILSPPTPTHSCCCNSQCGPSCSRHCCCTGRGDRHKPSCIIPFASSSSSRQCPGPCRAAGHSIEGDSAAAGVELWLHDSVQLHKPHVQLPDGQHQGPEGAAAAAGAGGRGGGRGRRARRGRSAAAGGSSHSGVTWDDVHKLIMECIGGCMDCRSHGWGTSMLCCLW
jgi:hypothetical protein